MHTPKHNGASSVCHCYQVRGTQTGIIDNTVNMGKNTAPYHGSDSHVLFGQTRIGIL